MERRSIRSWLLAGAVVLCGLGTGAVRAGTLDDAEAALRAQAPQRAAALLQGFSPATPQERGRMLWALAVIEMQQDRFAAAIPHLEALVVLAPDDASVRLELGRAYFMTQADGAARKQIAAAQAGNLSATERGYAEQFLQQMAERKTSETYLSFALIPESNAVKRTSAETMDIGALTFRLNANARKQAGVGLRLGFGHTLLPRLGNGLQGRLGLHFDGKLYRQSDISEATITAEAGLDKTLSPRAVLRGGVLAQLRFLGGREYSRGLGGYLSYSASIGTAGRFDARAEVMKLTYPGYSGADGLRSTLSLGYRHAVSPSLVLTGNVVLSYMDANLARDSGPSGALTLGLEKAFDGGFVLAGSVTKGFLRREARSALSVNPRRDDLSVITLRAYHSRFQIKGFAPTLEISHERQKSNIVLNDYANTRVSIGFTKRF
ncbi:DUF560 domain-containing protein [Pseudorhodobacter sp. E13]|uniref:surface lipoprotein assembly modifier n=1 Tax=Pseudorhodobacter sp. E13 TaxID=2487931 RepID=UPI000F8E652C|nr:surface lipoprotein assembly modifier [Pseudorhodobacter sp. E13]RUS59326.1 DUF560 domain-containing protein [Pseudorhodobacter sp. E13]